MLTTSFTINSKNISFSRQEFPFTINSFPHPYDVSVVKSVDDYHDLLDKADFIIVDKRIFDIYKLGTQTNAKLFLIDASESAKNMNTVLSLINEMIASEISKGSLVLAVGGGIIQDISACACALFRRGQPFCYLPSTSLGQLDSCVGAKCAINTDKAKNIIGLFSAPRSVIIPLFMISTMPINDHRAGLAEMLRLCLTASDSALNSYIQLFDRISNPLQLDKEAYMEALSLSLSIKKSVVDYDEYEKDVRRSMNYGHTFGHAIEKLVNFTIPHGIAVLIGMHISNTFSNKRGLMSDSVFQTISDSVKMTLLGSQLNFEILNTIDSQRIIDQFKYDKKGDGKSVPLIMISKPGHMFFDRYEFGTKSELLLDSISTSLDQLVAWSK